MNNDLLVKGGMVVAAIAIGYLVLTRSSGGATVYASATPAQSLQFAQLSEKWSEANLQYNEQIAGLNVNYAESVDKNALALRTAQIQGATADTLGNYALQSSEAQSNASVATAQINATAAQNIAQTQSAAQVTSAQAAAGAQKTSSFWNFLSGALGAVASFFSPAPGGSGAINPNPIAVSGVPTIGQPPVGTATG